MPFCPSPAKIIPTANEARHTYNAICVTVSGSLALLHGSYAAISIAILNTATTKLANVIIQGKSASQADKYCLCFSFTAILHPIPAQM